MPIENERKFVLRRDDECEREARRRAEKVLHITQGYLGDGPPSVRIRRSILNDKAKHYLTVKQRLNGHVWEVEKKIDKEDYEALWPTCGSRLEKFRCVMEGWEVDFFYSGGRRYFAMAEIELPEDKRRPDRVLPFVADRLVYAVPSQDNRFTSKKLCDVKHADKVFDQVSPRRAADSR